MPNIESDYNKNNKALTFAEGQGLKTSVKADANLTFSLGSDDLSEIINVDLAKIGNLLVADSSGRGKTQLLRSVICWLIYNNTPENIQLVLVDPKKVELTRFEKLENLFLKKIEGVEDSVIEKRGDVIKLLTQIELERNERVKLFNNAGVKNFHEYNAINKTNPLPYIVMIFDEIADFIRSKFELKFARLARLGVEAGIHIVAATQKPSPPGLTSYMSKNFQGRATFQISKEESITMCGSEEATALTDPGSFIWGFGESTQKLQSLWMQEDEIQTIVDYVVQRNK